MLKRFFHPELCELYEARQFSRLISRCEELLQEKRVEFGEQHPELESALYDMANAYMYVGNYQSSLKATLELLSIVPSEPDDRRANRVLYLNNLGMLHNRFQHPQEAEAILCQALELVDTLPQEFQWNRPTIQINLARFHDDRKEFKEAERLLVDAARQRAKLFGWGHCMFGDVFISFSVLYANQGKLIAAERAVQKSLRIYRKRMETEGPEYAVALNLLGDLKRKQGSQQEAAASYQAALEILERVRPADHPDIKKVRQQLTRIQA